MLENYASIAILLVAISTSGQTGSDKVVVHQASWINIAEQADTIHQDYVQGWWKSVFEIVVVTFFKEKILLSRDARKKEQNKLSCWRPTSPVVQLEKRIWNSGGNIL